MRYLELLMLNETPAAAEAAAAAARYADAAVNDNVQGVNNDRSPTMVNNNEGQIVEIMKGIEAGVSSGFDRYLNWQIMASN